MKDSSVSTEAIWAAASRKANPCMPMLWASTVEGAGVRRAFHLVGEILARMRFQPGFVIGQRIGHRHAQHIAALGSVERPSASLQRVRQQFLGLLGRDIPIAAFPINVGAQPSGIIGLVGRRSGPAHCPIA